MARLVIENPPPQNGRIVHGMDGVTRRRCRVCGCTVYGRGATWVCEDYSALMFHLYGTDVSVRSES